MAAFTHRDAHKPLGFFERARTIASPQFNRWLIPPCALAIHLCIGMAYGFSVFWLPMSRLLPPRGSECRDLGFTAELTTTTCNWSVPAVTHVFEIFIAMLGISAAIWGSWLERAGPRKAGFIAALCWGCGLVIGAVGVHIHQLWLLYLGCGFLGGIGQGIGYITPVSTLIKWFPDRRGMATGFAIMGYGGGAMIGSPLAVWLMARFANAGVPGVATTLAILGVLYFLVMTLGAIGFRVAPVGWRPAGWEPAPNQARVTSQHVHANHVWGVPQFWLLWGALCLNVTAGISVISMASPMLQEVFGTQLLGHTGTGPFSTSQRASIVAAAAGLVGLISLFNSLGRIGWATASDYLGRKNTYYVFFILGIVMYCLLPTLGHHGRATLFVADVCVIITMYGGGFATMPAYLADYFGTQMVGAIHGKLITSWSVAGVIGPALIAGLREMQLRRGVPRNLVYDRTLYIMAALLFVGLICNSLVKPLNPKHFMSEEQLAKERKLQQEPNQPREEQHPSQGRFSPVLAMAWLAVGVPFAIGLFIALRKAAGLLGV